MKRKPISSTFRNRWEGLVIWKSFWKELEHLVLKLVHGAWMSGYKAGLKEAQSPQPTEERK